VHSQIRRAASRNAWKGWRGALLRFTVQPTPKKVGTRKRSSSAFQNVSRARRKLGVRKS
jgi:hypothetical protein